ncbi:conserved hypothetical protein [metagenome]|uniref:Uncharacterized protein n=1 Tax=metagenome TaxID=256318 RepID=A0A2P2C6C7_9ZZZZ
MSSAVSPVWVGIVDDASIFPPGNVGFHDALSAHHARDDDGFVGSFVLTDTELPLARGARARLSVVLTGGAGQVAGPLGLGRRLGLQIAGVEIALRDPDDLPGNARRVVAALDAARDEGVLDDDLTVSVELPQISPTPGWLAAADVVAESELRLKFRTGGLEAHLFPSPTVLAEWIEAALDRETPFKCTAGLHHAVAHTDPETGFAHHGFLNVLLAARASLDGDDVVGVLAERDAEALTTRFRDLGVDTMARTRTWFTSFGSCSVSEPRDDLAALGLL